MRADGHTRRQEPEAGEPQSGTQVVALDALVLRHGAQHDQPLRVPAGTARRAELVDPPRARRQQVASRWREVPADASPGALAGQELVVGEAGDGLAGVLLLD